MAGLSLPTIQRMEASDGVIRGNVDSLMKLIAALDAAGIELIGEGGKPRRRPRRAAEGLTERWRSQSFLPAPPPCSIISALALALHGSSLGRIVVYGALADRFSW